MQNLSKEMVMENLESVMEKSWNYYLQSLCIGTLHWSHLLFAVC